MMNKLCRLGTAAAALLLATPPTTTSAAMDSKLRTGTGSSVWNAQESNPLLGHHRRLADSDANFDEAVAQADKIGKSVRDTIKDLRGGSDKFYRELVQAVKIYMCDQLVNKDGTEEEPKPSERFVANTSKLALKDPDGNCIRYPVGPISDTKMIKAYKLDKCEVKPNCYWSPVNLTDSAETDRRPVYSMDESMPIKEGAMLLDDAKNNLNLWAQGLMIFVVPGIILGVLGLLTMIFFLLCRCCCNRCGGRSPRDGGYTCIQKFLPVLFFLIFGAGIVVVAGISLLSQQTISKAIVDVFDTTSGTLVNTSDWIIDIRAPMIDISDKVVSSADAVAVELNGTDFIEDGIDGLTGKLEHFRSESADKTLPDQCTPGGATLCYPCEICKTIDAQVSKAQSQIKKNAASGVKDLKDIRGRLTTQLVQISSGIKSQVYQQVQASDVFIKTIDDTQKMVDDYYELFTSQKQLQSLFVVGLFGLALAVVAIGAVGILFGLTPLKVLANILHIAYVFGFIALFITFIISSIFLAVSVVMGDACEITKIFTEDWTVPLGEDANAMNACFRPNVSLIDVFNLRSRLEFANIEFPEAQDMKVMLNFSDLDAFAAEIQSTSASSTFNIDKDLIVAPLKDYLDQEDKTCVINDFNYDKDNIDKPWQANGEPQNGKTIKQYIKQRYQVYDTPCKPTGAGKPFVCQDKTQPCTFSTFMSEYYTKIADGVAQANDLDQEAADFVTEMHSDIQDVTDYTESFKTKTSSLDSSIQVIKKDLQASLIKHVQEFKNAMYCSFLGVSFMSIYDSLCGDLMPSLTMISLMLFLAGLFLFPVNICMIIACKRLKARGSGGHVIDNEMKFK